MNVETILIDYKVCALWSSEIDEKSIYDFSPATDAKFKTDVETFVSNNLEDLIASGLTEEQIGHSLWLTQNRHGAGFFDFPMCDAIEKRLTAAAQNLKECNLFIDDNGKVIAE